MKYLFFAGMLAALPAMTNADSFTSSNQIINLDDIQEHQKNWCSSLINISEVYESKGIAEAKKIASEMIDEQYYFENGSLLFKPTLAQVPHTFRTDKEGTLAYFVGNSEKYPEDKGFATKGWKKCNVQNYIVKNFGRTALVMGKTHFVDKHGNPTDVDKTWGFIKNEKGKLKVFLHHSSLEYKPSNSN